MKTILQEKFEDYCLQNDTLCTSLLMISNDQPSKFLSITQN